MANNHHPKDEAYLSSVIPKRIRIFEEIQAEQLEQLQSRPHDPIKITLLPDGIVKEGKRWETTPMDIAVQISKGFAKSALVSSVDHVLWDMNRPLEGDCSLEIFGFDSDQGRDTFWHSSALILGHALEQEYGCKLCIGPCKTIDEGFFCDAFYHGELGLNDNHFPNIEAGVSKAVQERQPFERIQVTKDQALEMFSDNKFKVEIVNDDLAEEATITVYRCGPLVDLCPGPHIPNTSFVKAFKCLKASASYWRGNSYRESLQRVYGISYPDNKQLKDYLKSIEEAKKYDHRLLGKQQGLIFCHEFSPGSWFFHEHGAIVYNKLMELIKKEYKKRGYKEVMTPNMYNMKLWATSGHAQNYKKNMFTFDIDEQEFGLKPMNCPGHCLVFQDKVRSYKELPIRMADFGVLHRNEESGALSGMTRVRRFVQDDAHIFCRVDQVGEEVKGVLDFIDYVYKIFGFTYELKLSTRPEKKYIGDLETWDKAEKDLEKALDNFGKPWVINKGDGAFYGPKIDITVSDAMKRKFQCATLQLDFQLPACFKLKYITKKNEKERPVMIHRAVLGSIERMFAILLEHYKGIWPFWLSPRQAIVCSLSEDYSSYAKQVQKQIQEAGYYVDIDESDRSICKKVADARAAPYNYILVVGQKEATTGQVTVRLREDPAGRKDLPEMSIDSLLDEFKFKTVNFL
ncbi:LOW QUALITY PROTEIN: probable threonine--tRNA ligase, cytoplasmic [Arabidopsis lyrata subsp. lyrata]|uniref:LOW QUALITY PROTEIN: probable threonine--tRNA ligase, cytoplasmic n=1 Tax=Arabidopsis lyrata subsp. lyrata TaxID=81972 RepID=UPI000A29D99C|nr:LOW QUALITY PROTEIN: probable threonine--tRNA ligase, cytoplasmic [Arabidopsis lyrata subsp. lyrata]|eukprot:XP_020866244.1 LOW QUALITY PROTEIN: probable threonine--tRNA ligase, cytoplasmic [Arabidopsis lyrata subsp. lyrata]